MAISRVLANGLAAGAAGATALNAVTYADMAIRGRPTSDTPEQLVEKISDAVGVEVPGDKETRANRLAGLGPLSGLVAGLAPAIVVAALRASPLRTHPVVEIGLATTLAMAASDGPIAAFGVSDPRTWPAESWASDIVPHLAYGVVTALVLRKLAP